MGFVNINGNNVHTSALSGSYGSTGSITTTTLITGSGSSYYTTAGSSYYSTLLAKSTYHILGEDVEVDGYKDNSIVMIIATINVLGKPYYDELLKQGVVLPSEISTFLERKFLILERDRKIDSIISDGLHDK
jgi:hypothetical protein